MPLDQPSVTSNQQKRMLCARRRRTYRRSVTLSRAYGLAAEWIT